MSKAPAFQFYPGDWQHDAALRMCSVAARGLWIEMICVMHQSNPYGHMLINGKPISNEAFARMIGASLKEVERWLSELEDAGVFSRDSDGVIFSRRMVKDEATRRARAAGGVKGGNPKLKVAGKVNLTANHELTLPLTPSSSSSSSSSPPNPQGLRGWEEIKIPDKLKTERFVAALERWAMVLVDKGNYSPIAIQGVVEKLFDHGERKGVAYLRAWCASNRYMPKWDHCFEAYLPAEEEKPSSSKPKTYAPKPPLPKVTA